MNRIVRERYPVSKLPEDLQTEFPGQEFVELVVNSVRETPGHPTEIVTAGQPEPDGNRNDTSLGGQFLRFKHLRRSTYKSIDEINAYVGSLRDEWAHRER